ncbi:kinase-like protein, partial [Nadsonia fulvescens var. elongata DSM 6958]
DRVIQDVHKKIEREKAIIQGAKAVRQKTDNTVVQQKCDANIREAQKNIEYLEATMKQLQLRKHNSTLSPTDPDGEFTDSDRLDHLNSGHRRDVSLASSSSSDSNNNNNNYGPSHAPTLGSLSQPRPNYTKLDLIKYDTPYFGPRIHHMLQQLEFKLGVEKQYLEGIEKMSKLYLMEGDRKSRSEAESKRIESSQKIQLLKKGRKKYLDMHVDIDELSNDSDNSFNIRRPLTGNLHIICHAIKDIDHVASARFSRAPESMISIKVEDQVRAKTKLSRNERWVEPFDFPVDKANEIELTVYDRAGDHLVPVGLISLTISDIAEALRRKRIEKELGSNGWVSADKMNNNDKKIGLLSNDSSNPSTTPRDGYNNNNNSINNNNNGSQQPGSLTAISNNNGMNPDLDNSETITAWFILEPAGQIQLSLGFEKTNRPTNRPYEALGGLGRQGAIRQKKEEIHEIHGHQFMEHQFYNIMRCAFCGDFLKYSVGFQCQDCRYTCHKSCYTKVVTKCISKSSTETDPDEAKLNHRIPHRFKPTTNLGANWCCHCGYFLPIGKKNIKKCSECNLTCHSQCAHLVPDFCGMSMEMANQILSEIKSTNIRRAAAASASSMSSTAASVASPSSSPSALVPNKVPSRKNQRMVGLNDFQLLAVLGKGNFGKVLLAEARKTGNLYAIKVLKKDFILENDEVESVRSEKRVFLVANRERHPFLLNLHSCFQTDKRIYFVMEYISGGDLMWHIQQEPFTPRRAKFYACEVLLALKYFHENGVIYRDLKLDNILLTLDGHIKIADYGLCKEEMWHGKTTGTFCGTPEFMAPEILLEQRYGSAVDWWAFGVLVYQMLLGQSPFRGNDEDEIFDAILSDEPLYPIHMARESVSILQALLTRDPEKRLGYGPLDAEDVMSHPYFYGVNFDDIYNCRVPPPFIPKVKSKTDVSNFDSEFTNEKPALTPVNSIMTQEMQEHFKGFSYL